MPSLRFAGRRIQLPRSALVRIPLGILLVLAGLLGFLPILGFWMVPLGLIVLSVDFRPVRRWRRHTEVRLGRWWRDRRRKADLERRYPFRPSRRGMRVGAAVAGLALLALAVLLALDVVGRLGSGP